MKRIVEFRNAKLGYGKRVVFDSLSLSIFEGDFLGIVGPNGSGKTTLLRGIIGLLKPRDGEIIKDRDLRFGYCMQRQFIDTLFPFTVFEIVMMARTKIIGPFKKPRSIDKDKVSEALEITGIQDLASQPFYNLSGGQKQRTIIARALSIEPNFLILDEPTADLDIKAEREIMELIKTLHLSQKLTVVLVTHELNEVINYAQKFIFLDSKMPSRIIAKQDLNEDLLSEIFQTRIKLKDLDGKQIVI
ncbi:MAG: ATP-binding cassette domain-containing protein [Nitrospira sp.]|nr:ATP-binding cassette domain-containing protein [Nitrospira sp.]